MKERGESGNIHEEHILWVWDQFCKYHQNCNKEKCHRDVVCVASSPHVQRSSSANAAARENGSQCRQRLLLQFSNPRQWRSRSVWLHARLIMSPGVAGKVVLKDEVSTFDGSRTVRLALRRIRRWFEPLSLHFSPSIKIWIFLRSVGRNYQYACAVVLWEPPQSPSPLHSHLPPISRRRRHSSVCLRQRQLVGQVAGHAHLALQKREK